MGYELPTHSFWLDFIRVQLSSIPSVRQTEWTFIQLNHQTVQNYDQMSRPQGSSVPTFHLLLSLPGCSAPSHSVHYTRAPALAQLFPPPGISDSHFSVPQTAPPHFSLSVSISPSTCLKGIFIDCILISTFTIR